MTRSLSIPTIYLVLILALGSCVRPDRQRSSGENSDTGPRIELSSTENLKFENFVLGLGVLSQRQDAVFHHPSLAAPLHFTSDFRHLSPSDPLGVRVLSDALHMDGEEVELSMFEERLQEYAQLVRTVGDQPSIHLGVSREVPFSRGMEIMKMLAANGVTRIKVASDRRQKRPPDPLRSKPLRPPLPAQ